jgi:hypothetical protein
MANEHEDRPPADDYMKGGKGRRDDVRGSRIYPASSPDAPADAEVRTAEDLVGHKGPGSKPAQERTLKKTDLSSGSE